jgi:catechol 2,3-dioxygenase-like lactoylglutathione lyase family enzyme
VLDHVTIRASSRAGSERFYRTVLSAIGITPTSETGACLAWQDFRLAFADEQHGVTRALHVAFVADTREAVDRFWQAGVDAGYEDLGAPGERPQYTASYYGGFLADPDGNSIEAVHHSDTRRGGHIDHLWIGVEDLTTAVNFYKLISRYTGLQRGRQWDSGMQFRGAWATFSLVHDGRPPGEHLHMAFAAPDSETVSEFFEAATAAGHRGIRAPEWRRKSSGSYNTASVIGPRDSVIESVYRPRVSVAESRGGR